MWETKAIISPMPQSLWSPKLSGWWLTWYEMKLDWLLHVCNYWDILWLTRHVFEWVNVWTRWTLNVRHNQQYMLALGFYYKEKKYLTNLTKLTEKLWLIRPQCFCPSHCLAKVFIPHFLIRFDEGYTFCPSRKGHENYGSPIEYFISYFRYK